MKKSTWGALKGVWVPHDTRDTIVDFVNRWSPRTELPAKPFVGWLGIGESKYYGWRQRYGKVNEHNGWVPRDFWLEEWEKRAITDFAREYPLEGDRRRTFMMLDRDVVAVSPSSVYRVLRDAGLLKRWNTKPSRSRSQLGSQGKGFEQPLRPHEHWHIDVSYINIRGTFYYLCSLLDGCSRYIVHWEIRESMTEADVEMIVQRAREAYPDARPRTISDSEGARGGSRNPAVPREGLQGVHPNLRHAEGDQGGSPKGENVAVLSANRGRPRREPEAGRSSGGIVLCRPSASGPGRRCRWKTPVAWSAST